MLPTLGQLTAMRAFSLRPLGLNFLPSAIQFLIPKAALRRPFNRLHGASP